jgi:hypothetical protein
VNTSRKLIVVGVAVVALVGVRVYLVRQGVSAAAAPRVEAGSTVPHRDHSPRHGGLVLMRGDTHFEVVLGRGGMCQVYFTDATRTELPASFASEVDIGLASLDGGRQNVPFQVDPEGKMWIGRLTMTSDPHAIVRVTYVARGEQPYWIDVPLSAWPGGRD